MNTAKALHLPVRIFSLIMSAIVLTACGRQAESPVPVSGENKLVIYTAHKEEIYGPIVREFENRTGIWVEVVSGGTNELLGRLGEESEHPHADIMFGGGVDSLSAYSDLFEPYRSSRADQLDLTYGSETDSYTPFSTFPLVFIYNKKLVYSAATPRSWEELTQSRWKGQIAFASPINSGSAYTALCGLLMSKGTSNWEETLAAFTDNMDGAFCAGSSEVAELVMSGDKLIGVTTEDLALKKISEGADIGITYPQEGTCILPDGTAIVKNCEHQGNAQLFLEFTVSDDVQKLLQDQCHRRAIRTDLQSGEMPAALAYDIRWANENRDQISGLLRKAAGQE